MANQTNINDFIAETPNTNGTVNTGAGDPAIAAIVSQLQSAATTQSEAINSSQTNIESRINAAIESTKAGTTAETTRIESQFGRELGYARDKAGSEFQNFSESRSGFGTQMGAFRELVKTTDKYMADLEQRKQELILQNNSAGAAKVADLEIKALEYQEKAKQQVFDNILKTGSFSLQLMSEDRAGREFVANLGLQKEKLNLDRQQFEADTQAKMAELATEYGVTVEDGDTMADIVKKVMPQANAEAKARLNRILAETRKINDDLQKDTTMANFQSRVAQLVAGGATPSEAALQAMAEGKAVGLDIDAEMFNQTSQYAQEAKDAIDKATRENVSNSVPGYWESVFTGMKETSVFGEGEGRGLAGEALDAWLKIHF